MTQEVTLDTSDSNTSPPKRTRQYPNPETCTVDGCDRPFVAKGMCLKHYNEARLKDPSRPRCESSGCEGVVLALGLCKAHYYQQPKWLAVAAASTKRWKKAHPEYEAAYRLANLERVRPRRREWARQWRAANPELNKARVDRWRKAHPAQFAMMKRIEAATHRARQHEQFVGRVDYAAILAEHGMICHICGEEIEFVGGLHFDHLIPLAKGGSHTADNIKPSHALCNQRKGERTPT